MPILIINSGSSSIKFSLFEKKAHKMIQLAHGIADAIGLKNSELRLDNGKVSVAQQTPLKNHADALKRIFQALQGIHLLNEKTGLQLIGHRVVHGGEKYQKPIQITPDIIRDLKKVIPQAPLHNPANISCIEGCAKIFPQIPQVAVFDTAFHQTMPEIAYLYALPIVLHQKHGIRKYGFHGINHQHVSSLAQKLLRTVKYPSARLITLHLGNGCSMTAIKNGRSVENSMGYTPLEGLPMGSRSGDLDPALVKIIGQKTGKTLSQTIDFLNQKSGLLGLSGLSSDMRTVWAAAQKGHKRALLTLDIYAYRIAKYLNAYIGVLGGVDAIVFTAGVGENAWYVRNRILNYVKHLNITPDPRKNKSNATYFQSKTSSAKLMIIPANEELEIAMQADNLLR